MSTPKTDEDIKQGVNKVEKKENQPEEYSNIKVVNQDGDVVYFKIKRTAPLKKLLQTYCTRKGLSITNVRFRFEGEAIDGNDSPAKLQMEDDDAIEVFQQQSGGCNFFF